MFSIYMSLADDINLIKCPRSWYLVAQLNTWLFVMILFQHRCDVLRWEWSAGAWVVAVQFQESMQMSKGKEKAILIIGHKKDFVICTAWLIGISSLAFRLSSWIESEITRENLRRGTKSG